MDKQLLMIAYYECYGTLLTEKQCYYFEQYYFENLTLSEIAENEVISRNGVYKQIKEACSKLQEYEEKLQFVTFKKQLIEWINTQKQISKEELIERLKG